MATGTGRHWKQIRRSEQLTITSAHLPADECRYPSVAIADAVAARGFLELLGLAAEPAEREEAATDTA